MRIRDVSVGLVALGCVGLSASCSTDSTLLVLSASSAQDAIRELAASEPVSGRVSSGGSTALVRQLKGGARADVLVTADEATMLEAVGAGLTETDPVVFATSRLAVVVPAGSATDQGGGLAALDFEGRRLVLCSDPVPCGAAAQRALADAGISPDVSSFEPNSRQALAKVALGEADAALVWDVDAASEPRVETLDTGSRLPVTKYYAVVLRDSVNTRAAHDFVARLVSDEGQKVLASHGFGSATDGLPQ